MASITAVQTVSALYATRGLVARLRSVGSDTPSTSLCDVWERGVPQGFDPDDLQLLDKLAPRRIHLHKRQALFRAGEAFTSLYAIRVGSCKTVLPGEDGQDQVAGYHMAGDIIGADGIGVDRHDCEAVALEDMEVSALPFDRIEELARRNIQFQRGLNRFLSREITRERRVALILGTMHADQRLATFLLDLSQRYQERGYSSVEFILRMTREEIGSYLGLKLETVSRLFSRFHEEGLIQIDGRTVKLLDRVVLRKIVGHEFAGRNA